MIKGTWKEKNLTRAFRMISSHPSIGGGEITKAE